MKDNSFLQRLSRRQIEIAAYVRKGLTDKDIAHVLGISIHTVKSHLKKIYEKMEVSGRTELAGLSEWGKKESKIQSMDGYWLSRFEYNAHRTGLYVTGVQYNLEFLYKQHDVDFFPLAGANILCSSSNSELKYYHNLKCHIERNNLIGVWINRKNTRNIGCFQLYISNNNFIMSGKHLGNASDNSIQTGNWLWIKVKDIKEINPNSNTVQKEWKLFSFNALESKFQDFIIESVAINPFKILEKVGK